MRFNFYKIDGVGELDFSVPRSGTDELFGSFLVTPSETLNPKIYCDIQFFDKEGNDYPIVKDYRISNVKAKKFLNPYARVVYGKGFWGSGKQTGIDTKVKKEWKKMIRRCHSDEFKKHTYSMIEEWENATKFQGWIEFEKIELGITGDDYELVLKDGCKYYSKDTLMVIDTNSNNEIELEL